MFFNTTKQLKVTASFLAHEHVAMATLVRGDSSSTRAKSLENFRKGTAKFLLTTDVAARGLDIPDLPAVINFDLPRNGETYTHRAGRTGRMGKHGLVISFGNDHDLRDLRRLVAVDIQLVNGASQATKPTSFSGSAGHTVEPGANKETADKPRPVAKVRKAQKKKAEEVVARTDRFAKEKKAKRKHSKNKGKPKRKNGEN